MQIQEISDEQLEALHRIHSELSPEFLTCDGELPESVWLPRAKELNRELLALADALGLPSVAASDSVVFDEVKRRRNLARRRPPRA